MNVPIHPRPQPMAGNPGPLRFLVTADSFLPHSGGSRVYYADLYKNLLAMYPDTMTVLTRKVPGWKEFDRHETGANFRIKRFLKPLPNWRYWQLPKAIPQFVGEAAHVITGNYDCLHCGDLFPQGLNGVALRRLFRLPMLMFCHGDEISQTDRRQYQPRVRNFIYRHADVIIAANQFAYDGLVRIGIPEDRLHKLTPGVNLEQFHPAPPRRDLVERYGLQGAKVLLTVARMVPRKGHKIVLEALPKVIREVPNLKYIIAGDGPEGPKLQQQARQLGIQDAVIFAGDIPHGEICDFYNLCDVLIMANRLEAGGDVESFGMVFTEANAVGKPVIGGRSGGTAEAVLDGKTGFLADPGNADEIAGRLLQLLKNEDLAASMGSFGMARVRAEFNWSTRAHAVRQISAEMVMRARRTVASPAEGPRPEDSGVSA